jgi:hypothetical protein
MLQLYRTALVRHYCMYDEEMNCKEYMLAKYLKEELN